MNSSLRSTNGTNGSAKPLGIFWDIDNCPIPLTTSASAVVAKIQQFIGERHPECSFAKEFVVATDVSRLSEGVTQSLNNQGVFISHVPPFAKNAADDKLQEHIDHFIDNFGDKSPVLVVITGDINFAKAIRNARKRAIVVVLIFGDHCSPDLKTCANESYSFADIIAGVENVANDSAEQRISYVKVSNLPKDKPIKEILRVLSRLLANCGGKPINYCDGSALVQFGCQEDGLRAVSRFQRYSVYGKQWELYAICEGLDDCPLLQEFNICKSVISGLPFSPLEDVYALVINVITDWDDPDVNEELIAKVEAMNPFLVVTAVTPGANKKLLSCAERHLSQGSGIQWTYAEDYKSIEENGWSAKSPAELVSDDRRSVIKGLSTRIDENVTESVKELVDSWNDSELKGSLVFSVERNTKLSDTEVEGVCNLFVTAVSAEASKALVTGAKRHIGGTGLKWTAYKHKFQSSEECKSVIKGLDTTGVENKNLMNFVRNIVKQWSDPRFRGEYIVSVERNTAQNKSLPEEKSNLFVTATTPQTSRALIRGAKQYIKAEHNVRWTAYEPKPIHRNRFGSIDGNSDSGDSDCSFYSTTSSASFVSNVSNKSRTQRPAETHRSVSTASNTMTNSRVSIITGLNVNKDDNVLKAVRKLVSSWRERNINGNMIEKVERDPIFAPIDGKVPLFVTAYDVLGSKALVAAAKRCLNPNSGIKWNEFHGKSGQNRPKQSTTPKAVPNAQINRPPLLPYPPFPANYNPILNPYNQFFMNYPHFQFSQQLNPLAQLMANPFAQTLYPYLQTPVIRPSAPNINPFIAKKAEPNAQTPQKNGKDPAKDSAKLPPLSVELLLASAERKLAPGPSGEQKSGSSSVAAKEVPKNNDTGAKPKTTLNSKTSPSDHKRLSFITGLKIKSFDDVTRAVRRIVMQWNEKLCNGNVIIWVERVSTSSSVEPVLKVWTKTEAQTKLLVAYAKEHLKPGSGISWTHTNPSMGSSNSEPKSKAEAKAPAVRRPNAMFVITGQKTRHNENLLLLVRQLLTELFKGKVNARDVVDVTRDFKWGTREGNAMLFVTVVEPKVKDLILESAKSLVQTTGLEFKDYNGFKH